VAARPATAQSRRELFDDAQAVIARDYAHSLTLDAVAREIASSRRALQRAYEEQGTSFRAELNAVRMDAAAQLITRGSTARAAAQAVGHRQPAQFARAFRRRHGVSPSRFAATPA
jgi:AraC-like DNA-binding protein